MESRHKPLPLGLEYLTWYQQRICVEQDPEARAIMENAQEEEFLHFAMDLEFLSRRLPRWKVALQQVLFRPGDIIQHKEKGEDQVEDAPENTQG